MMKELKMYKGRITNDRLMPLQHGGRSWTLN